MGKLWITAEDNPWDMEGWTIDSNHDDYEGYVERSKALRKKGYKTKIIRRTKLVDNVVTFVAYEVSWTTA